MKGKLLRGISGSVQPRRLLHGYQDAVFAWSGENPFANLAQSTLYRILQRTQYSNSWIKSTPYGKAFRADTYSGSGNGYVFSSHVPNADQTYVAGITGYVEFVYSANISEGQFIQHLCCIKSTADGDTGNLNYGFLTLGFEYFNDIGLCPIFRAGDNTPLLGFAGGWAEGASNTLVPVSIPVGTKVRQIVAFDPVSKACASILAFDDVVYERYSTVANGFASTGSSILVGGYPRNGARAAFASGVLEAAVWNRYIPLEEMRSMLQRPSIFQPTEFIFPFSFGESSDGSDIIKCSKSNLVVSANAAQIIWSETINCTTSELILSSKDCAIVLNDPPLIFDTDDYPDRYVFDVYQTPPNVDVITCTSADIAIQTNSCVIVDAENINCSQHPLTLNAYSCDIFETALDALNCLKAELDLQTNICAVLQSEIINCVSHNLDLSSNAAEIAEKLIIESAVSNISLIAYDCDIQDSANVTGSVNFGTANTSRYFLSDAMSGMDLSGDFSIVAVISPDYTVSNRHKYFFSTAASSSDPNGLNLYLTSNYGFLSLLPGNGSSAVSSAPVPPGWCLVYARRIAGVLSVGFVDLSNGTHTKSNTPSSSGNFSNNVAVIGGRFDLDATRFYTGGMSWIALLETGLSNGQIESIAAGTIGLLNDFEPSIVELWDMTYNRLIQPGVVNGINAQRFGDGWGVGGDNPLPYEIEEPEIISAIPATIALSAEISEIYETEILSSDTPVLQLISNNCQLIEQGLDVINYDRADINIKSNNSVILYNELIDCSSASIALSAEVSEIRETEILGLDTQVLQLISNNCQLIEQGLEVINCSENVTLLSANKCNIVQEGLDVIYCDTSTLQISGNKFSTVETDIISSQVANLSLLANKSFVADTQSILCQKYSVSLVSNICNIVEAGLDVIHAKRANLRLDPTNCEIIEFGFDNILCNVGSVQLAAQNCDIYDIEVISCVSATLDVQSSSCDIVEEGLNVVHCKKADIELISNKCSIAENEIVNCEQGLVTAQTKKCQIIEFIDFRATKLDLISNSSSVLSNEAINCNAVIININSKRALIVDSNVPPILWSGKIVVNGYVEPIRGIA